MPSFDELHIAAEAAQTAYQRYGQTAQALQGWLTAEVGYQEATGCCFVKAPSSPPQMPYQFEVYRAIAATLCGLRHRHYDAFTSTRRTASEGETIAVQAAS